MNFMVEHYWNKAKDAANKLFSDERGLQDAVNIVLALVMIVVVGAIGIFVADRTVTATGTPVNDNLSAMGRHHRAGNAIVLGVSERHPPGLEVALAISYMFGL